MKIWAKILTVSILGLSLIGCGGGSKGTSALGERSFTGQIIDVAGKAVPLAGVFLIDPALETTTDIDGTFAFLDVPVAEEVNLLVTASGKDFALNFATPEYGVVSLAITLDLDAGTASVKVSDASGETQANTKDDVLDPISNSNDRDNDDSSSSHGGKKKGKKHNVSENSDVDLDPSNAHIAAGGEAEEVASIDDVQKATLDEFKGDSVEASQNEIPILDDSFDSIAVDGSTADSPAFTTTSDEGTDDDESLPVALDQPTHAPTGGKGKK